MKKLRLRLPKISLKGLFKVHWEKNPLWIYNKVKSFFKAPKAKFYFGSSERFQYSSITREPGKLFDLEVKGLSWYDSSRTPVPTFPPIVSIILFKRLTFAIWWEFSENKIVNDEYWASVLKTIYYGLMWNPVEACGSRSKEFLKDKAFLTVCHYKFAVGQGSFWETWIPSHRGLLYKCDRLAKKRFQENFPTEPIEILQRKVIVGKENNPYFK